MWKKFLELFHSQTRWYNQQGLDLQNRSICHLSPVAMVRELCYPWWYLFVLLKWPLRFPSLFLFSGSVSSLICLMYLYLWISMMKSPNDSSHTNLVLRNQAQRCIFVPIFTLDCFLTRRRRRRSSVAWFFNQSSSKQNDLSSNLSKRDVLRWRENSRQGKNRRH